MNSTSPAWLDDMEPLASTKSASVLVRVFGVGALGTFGFEFPMMFLECVGDVLEEDKPQDDVLVLGGVHRAAQSVGHFPKLRLVADSGGGRVRIGCVVLLFCQWLPHSIVLPE